MMKNHSQPSPITQIARQAFKSMNNPLGMSLLCVQLCLSSAFVFAGGDDDGFIKQDHIEKSLTENNLAKRPSNATLVAQANTQTNNAAATLLQSKLDKMHSLQGRFRQVLRDDEDKVLQDSTGHVYMQRPGKLRWETEQPYQTVTVSADSVLWRYDIDLEQVTRDTVPDDISLTPALLLSGNSQALSKSFEIHIADNPPKSSTAYLFSLTPLGNNSLFKELFIGFNKNDTLVNMTIIDDLDQRTSIGFTDMEINKKIAPQLFIFTPPPGVDLLDNS